MQTNASTIESKQYENQYYLFNRTFFSDAFSDLFCSTYWQNKGAITGQETGRGTTWFLHHQNHDLVLRHYLRGGLVSKISRERYLFRRWKSCRSISEFHILNELSQLGLRVPIPAAAKVIRHGLSYQADLLTQRIPNAQDLVQVLKNTQDETFYKKLGQFAADSLDLKAGGSSPAISGKLLTIDVILHDTGFNNTSKRYSHDFTS